MVELLPFLQKYEVWIYVLLGVIAFVYLRKLITAWKEWQGTVFGLERESAQRRFSTSLTILVLLGVFVLMEFMIVSFVAPSYPRLAALPTPTLDILATQTVTLPASAAQAVTSATPGATLTPTGQALTEGCIPGQIEWSSPKPGDKISDTVELLGTVNVPNLGFYKYEYSQAGEDTWTTIAAGNQPKVNGQIGFWNTSTLDVGDYQLRLVVADNQNKLFSTCIVPVTIVGQQ